MLLWSCFASARALLVRCERRRVLAVETEHLWLGGWAPGTARWGTFTYRLHRYLDGIISAIVNVIIRHDRYVIVSAIVSVIVTS